MPPLRERLEDIPTLVEAFLASYRSRNRGVGPIRLSEEAIRLLQGAAWPGNVRQLRNAVEAAAASVASLDTVGAADVAEFLPLWTVTASGAGHRPPTLAERIRWAEERAIVEALRHTGGRKAAAQLLDVSEATLYRKLGRLRSEGRFPSLLPDADDRRSGE